MTENNENTESTGSTKETKRDPSFGKRMYPGRVEKNDYSWTEKIMQQTYDADHCRILCETNVVNAFKKNPLLKILRGALKNAGCPLDLKRHIVCEDCNRSVQGGYDNEFNQIVVCKNLSRVRNQPEAVLLHELIHMYDNCVNEMNFKSLEHLACSEIRAANIAHCSFLGSFVLGQSSPINIKKTHQYCVKTRAAQSLVMARDIDFPTAVHYVLKVFDKCYNDLEPVGRRVRRNSIESAMAEEEAKCFLISN